MKCHTRSSWLAVGVILLACGMTVRADESVDISLPASVSFQVLDVTTSATGDPSSTTMTFNSAALTSGHALRISVKAESDLMTFSGSTMSAANISWHTSNAANGLGIDGTLSKTAFTEVFESQVGASGGHLDISWNLSAPSTPLRAGVHQVTLRWKVESFVP
jgi:hypothetical protein